MAWKDIVLDLNNLDSQNPIYTFIKVTLNNGTVIRMVGNNEALTFLGETWNPIHFSGAIFHQTAKGELPVLTVSVDDVEQHLLQQIRPLQGTKDHLITIYRVNWADSALPFKTINYLLLKTETNPQSNMVVFHLGAANLIGVRLLPLRYLADFCSWIFCWEECTYQDPGASKVNISGQSYYCKVGHVASAENHPVTGTSEYQRLLCWRPVSSGGATWVLGTSYTRGTATCNRTIEQCRDYGVSNRFCGKKGLANSAMKIVL